MKLIRTIILFIALHHTTNGHRGEGGHWGHRGGMHSGGMRHTGMRPGEMRRKDMYVIRHHNEPAFGMRTTFHGGIRGGMRLGTGGRIQVGKTHLCHQVAHRQYPGGFGGFYEGGDYYGGGGFYGGGLINGGSIINEGPTINESAINQRPIVNESVTINQGPVIAGGSPYDGKDYNEESNTPCLVDNTACFIEGDFNCCSSFCALLLDGKGEGMCQNQAGAEEITSQITFGGNPRK